MASTERGAARSKQQLPAKLPPLSKDQRISHRQIISRRAPSTAQSHRLYVTAGSPFRSITTRVRKQLNKSLRTASSSLHPQAFTNRLAGRSLPLSARIQAIQNSQGNGSGVGLENAREVVVIGCGRAIEKVVNVAAFFRDQGDCTVQLKTGSLQALDEVVGKAELEQDNTGFTETQTRERMVSCLEAVIRLK